MTGTQTTPRERLFVHRRPAVAAPLRRQTPRRARQKDARWLGVEQTRIRSDTVESASTTVCMCLEDGAGQLFQQHVRLVTDHTIAFLTAGLALSEKWSSKGRRSARPALAPLLTKTPVVMTAMTPGLVWYRKHRVLKLGIAAWTHQPQVSAERIN